MAQPNRFHQTPFHVASKTKKTASAVALADTAMMA